MKEDIYYRLSIEETIEKTCTSLNGLNEKEAKKRLEENGYNKLIEAKKKTVISRFIDQMKNVMIIILLIDLIFL